jgi:ABC-type multidrug transport system fused ATPase/permease subunit
LARPSTASTISPCSLQELPRRRADDGRDSRTKPGEEPREDGHDRGDAATESRQLALLGIGRAAGARIDAIGVGQHAGGRQILHDLSFSIEPGELIALVGGSGAEKTTLLEILAGLRAPSTGQVMHDGVRVEAGATRRSGVGYVPQDDIIHGEMPLRRTLQYAARLRLPAGTSS